jgi:glycosyltransferase involved in cell wall biosynthesis
VTLEPVLLVAFHFPPSGAIGGQRMRRMYELLPQFGVRPYVLTIGERAGESFDASAPERYLTPSEDIVRVEMTLSLRERYRSLKRLMERARGRAPAGAASGLAAVGAVPPSEEGSVRRFARAMLKMPDENLSAWYLPAVRAGFGLMRRHRIRWIIASSPPPSALLVASTLRALTGARLIADFRDPWAAMQGVWGRPGVVATDAIHAALERSVVRAAERVVTVTDRMTAQFRRRYPELDPDRFITIPNAVDPSSLAPTVDPVPADRFELLHAGSLYGRRDPTPLFQALPLAVARGVPRGELRLRLVGDQWTGVEALNALADRLFVRDLVAVEGLLPRAEVLALSRRAALVVILAQDQPDQVPGKVYEAVASMRPILALTGDGATADVLAQVGGAHVVEPGRPDAIADAIWAVYRQRVLNEAEAARRRRFIEAMDPVVLTERLAKLVQRGRTESAPFDRRRVG